MHRVISNYMMQWAVIGSMAVVLVSNGHYARAPSSDGGHAL